MSMEVKITFRNGDVKRWPGETRVLNNREWSVKYQDGVVTVSQYEGQSHTFPLDLVESVEETPRPRF